jgi:hypothetical protein
MKANRKSLAPREKKLDRIFSMYIRVRDSVDGICQCCTCGALFPIDKMDAGHFMSRIHKSTRWDERNVAGQCRYCNRYRDGAQYQFSKYIDHRWGTGTSEILFSLSVKPKKWTAFELDFEIAKFTELLNRLKAEKEL